MSNEILETRIQQLSRAILLPGVDTLIQNQLGDLTGFENPQRTFLQFSLIFRENTLTNLTKEEACCLICLETPNLDDESACIYIYRSQEMLTCVANSATHFICGGCYPGMLRVPGDDLVSDYRARFDPRICVSCYSQTGEYSKCDLGAYIS